MGTLAELLNLCDVMFIHKFPLCVHGCCLNYRAAQAQPVSPEMALCRQVIETHQHSVVKIGCWKRENGGDKRKSRGTGFIVHMDANFCLVMSCGHVLEDHLEDKSIHVAFGDIEIEASVVFGECDNEVSMLRVDKSTSPRKFAKVASYTPVTWSDHEAQEKSLVAILSRDADLDKILCRSPSVFHGTVS